MVNVIMKRPSVGWGIRVRGLLWRRTVFSCGNRGSTLGWEWRWGCKTVEKKATDTVEVNWCLSCTLVRVRGVGGTRPVEIRNLSTCSPHVVDRPLALPNSMLHLMPLRDAEGSIKPKVYPLVCAGSLHVFRIERSAV